MTVEALAAWMLSIMLATVPPGHSRRPAEAKETAEAGRTRYEAIATALARVALDPTETPLFDGPDGRRRTASLMLAIARYESTWRRDVDLGIGPRARGGGRYWCMMQIAVDRGHTPEGWTGKDLIKSRAKCFRRALHILQRGQRVCRRRSGSNAGSWGFLNHYASGHCNRGRKAVAKRIRTYNEWWREFPFEPERSPP